VSFPNGSYRPAIAGLANAKKDSRQNPAGMTIYFLGFVFKDLEYFDILETTSVKKR